MSSRKSNRDRFPDRRDSLRKKVARMNRMVESFREGRVIPADLHGRGRADQTISIVTDGLDKWFALLDGAPYEDAYATPPVVRSQTLTLTDREVMCVDEHVVQLTFTADDGSELPPWSPGMHLDFHLPSGRKRQYSLCGGNVGFYSRPSHIRASRDSAVLAGRAY